MERDNRGNGIIKWFFLSFFLLTGVTTSRGATVYTDQATFLSNVQSGYYLETFDSLPPFPPPPLYFSMNGFSYTATTATDLFYTLGGSLSTYLKDVDILLTLTSNNITAIGGYFFLGTQGPQPEPVLTLTLSDGTSVSIADPTHNFIGFITTTPIQSLVMSTRTNDQFVGVDDLIVGSAIAVPEAPISVLLGIGVMGFAGFRAFAGASKEGFSGTRLARPSRPSL